MMKKKRCKPTDILRAISLPLVGTAGAWLYRRYAGCAADTCAITSGPWLFAGIGCILGSLLYTVLRPDRSGNIVGEPIVGAITEKKQAETLQKLIEQALAADVG